MEYDVAISFAGEERYIADELASKLDDNGVRVFYDDFELANTWGKNLYEHLIEIYRDSAKYCVMILSKAYADKIFTNHERQAAQDKALKEKNEYILPIRVDDSQIPGIFNTTAYIDYSSYSIDKITDLILTKLWGDLAQDKGLLPLKNQLEELYNRMMGACELAFAPTTSESYNSRGLAPTLLSECYGMLKKLRSDFQINAPNMDGLIISHATNTLNAMEDVLERAHFLLLLRNPDFSDRQFVSEIPEENLNYVYNILTRMKNFDGYAARNRRHFKPNEIIDNWEKAEKEEPRYLSTPEEFVWQNGLTPFLFNHTTLRRFRSKGPNSGDKIYIFKHAT